MPEEHIPQQIHLTIYFLIVACIAILFIAVVGKDSQPPENFVSKSVVHVEKNVTLSEVGNELYSEHIIQSPLLFRIIVTSMGGGKSIGAGDYLFKNSENIWQVAYRFAHHEQDLSQIRVTFPEGITVDEMGNILASAIDSSTSTSVSASVSDFTFDKNGFLALASTSEGYLFPDTYFFLPNEMPIDIINTMKRTFNKKIATLVPDSTAFQASTTVKSYPRTLANIVTIASILEREATSTADRRIIAGILWKRLDAGEPLQVDSPFMYSMGKTSAELTMTDLATSSPYNTYNHTGVPPTPIGNPGLDALTDAITPVATKYWYYVNDTTGMIHYATTYAEQEKNQTEYVK